MTRGSLQSQSLAQVLRAERPETDRKRTDLLKLQGEFKLKLRQLEKALLDALNASSGNILDDDKVIDTLERLKREAGEITRKASETDIVMEEVEQVTSQYLPLSHACSSLFFVLDQLSSLHHFYQFSLRFFLDIFDFVLLRNPRLKGVADPQQRLAILIEDLFLNVFKRTSRSLLNQDHFVLAVVLAQLRLRDHDRPAEDEALFDYLLEGNSTSTSITASLSVEGLTTEQNGRLARLTKLEAFKPIVEHVKANESEWTAFVQAEEPEVTMPSIWRGIDGTPRCPPGDAAAD